MAMKQYKQLYAEYGQEEYSRAYEFFRAHGISTMGYSDKRRMWSMMAIGRKDGPTVVILWVSLEGFIELLDAPHATLKRFHEQGGDVRM
jgi:hypothetical protein